MASAAGYGPALEGRQVKLDATVVSPVPTYAAVLGYMQIGRVAVTAPVFGLRITPSSEVGGAGSAS